MSPPGRVALCACIPTWNEAGAIGALLEGLGAALPGPEVRLLVVDDHSPDGTAAVVRAAMARDPRILLLEAPRAGFAAASRRGLLHAVDVLGACSVVQMDGDGSHRPEDVALLAAALERSGADVLVGSRYVAGGSLDPRWPLRRRLLSAAANALARRLARLAPVRDCTAGFKILRARAVRAADLRSIRVRGHAFQLVLLHRLLDGGLAVREHPIHFRERVAGTATLGPRAILEVGVVLLGLAFVRRRRMLRFGLVGLLGVGVNLGAFALLLAAGLAPAVASPIAIEGSILSNLLLSRRWTFADRGVAGGAALRRFHAVALAALCASYGTFLALCALVPAWLPIAAQALAVVPGAVLSWLGHSRWTFPPGVRRSGAARGGRAAG